jgi:nucleoside-diphosphate kinase
VPEPVVGVGLKVGRLKVEGMERTLAIIKPDAVRRGLIGKILAIVEENGLTPRALRLVRLSKAEAEGFYQVHRERPFFDSLTTFMSEGPVVVMVLEGRDAIARWRAVMGATDPARAEEGTIRRLLGESLERNSVHGSDGPATAEFEIGYFFSALDQVG